MSKYTDADVARMLGWTHKEHFASPLGIWVDAKGHTVCIGELHHFMEPGPEADANAARYVLPWIRENGMLYPVLECAAKGYKTNKQLYGARNILGYDFAQTLCTAALEAASNE